MGRKLYVGNLPYQTGETELTELFSRAGTVESARIMRDMATGRARGFGFVEMASDEEAQRAISELNEFKMEGRPLVVNEARPKPMGGGGGGGGGFERGNRGGEWHVRMQHAAGLRQAAMNLRVDEHRGGFDLTVAFEHLAFVVHEQYLARAQFGPVISKWIHQEPVVAECE